MKQWYLIAYDVKNPRRLRRVHYYLRSRSVALQRSVYIYHCRNSAALDEIVAGVGEIASTNEDDIRIYPVTSPASVWAAGAQNAALRGQYGSGNPDVTGSRQSESIVSRLLGIIGIGDRKKR